VCRFSSRPVFSTLAETILLSGAGSSHSRLVSVSDEASERRKEEEMKCAKPFESQG